MKKLCKFISVFLLMALLSGCMLTVDQMYCIPKRSETDADLQSSIDKAMSGMSYSAPLYGENQQTVQMADLDGDGVNEYLVFAKSAQEEKPLRILVFKNVDGEFVNTDTVVCNGTAFEQVEYTDMDGNGSVEILIGRQLSDQLIRSVTVYTFESGRLLQLNSVNYTKFLTADLNADSYPELFILRPGQTDTDNGVAELYKMNDGSIERYNEVTMSQPVDMLKRILVGKLSGGETAVYVASTVDEVSLVTDVFALKDSHLANISLLDKSHTSVQTLRNFYIYADDIDDDSVVELPRLVYMKPVEDVSIEKNNHLICWYTMSIQGDESTKMYTYHDFVGGWYMQLMPDWAERTSVVARNNVFDFYVWNSSQTQYSKVMSIVALSGQDAAESTEGYIPLYKTDMVTYAAVLSENAKSYGLDEQNVKNSFHLIQQEWKTGEV